MMANDIHENVKRWTTKRHQALVLQIVRGETTAVETARQHGLTVGGDRSLSVVTGHQSGTATQRSSTAVVEKTPWTRMLQVGIT